MSASPMPTGPAHAAESPPKKESARILARNEHAESATPASEAQESRLVTLGKAWMRATGTDRALFLADVRAGCPNLWRTIDRGAGGPA